MRKRYEAEWIEKQHTNEYGDWDPDKDEYVGSYHKTFEAALQAARTGAKASGIPWLRVTEQHENFDDGPPAYWDNVRVWSGDLDGYEEVA
jgi:hypothetical protein